MRRHFLAFVLLVLTAMSTEIAPQTIYFKKDHIYAGPNGPEIAIVTPTPTDQTAPSAPGLSQGTVTPTSIQLTWSASSETGGSGLAGYKVYRQRGSAANLPVGTVTALSFTDEPLQPSTAYTYTVVAFDKAQNHSAPSNTVTVATSADPNRPSGLIATATSTTQVSLTWTASTGASSYQIERSFNNSGYSQIATSATTSYTDNTVSAGVTYLYRVRAVDGGGNPISPYSNVDLATTIFFTDDPVTAGVAVKAQHFTELRQAVNAVRASAGLSASTWTDPTLNSAVLIKAVHLQEMRNGLGPALSAVGLAPPAYTDPTVTAGVTAIKKEHVNELRLAVK